MFNDFDRIILRAEPEELCLRGASYESKRATWRFKLFDILLSASFLILWIFFKFGLLTTAAAFSGTDGILSNLGVAAIDGCFVVGAGPPIF